MSMLYTELYALSISGFYGSQFRDGVTARLCVLIAVPLQLGDNATVIWQRW